MAERASSRRRGATDLDLRGAPRLVAPGARGGRIARSATASSRRCWSSTSVDMGFTHVELLPGDGAPLLRLVGLPDDRLLRARRSRMGTPDDFKFLVDQLHQAGIGVILDWVPSHFPADAFAPGALRRHPPLRARRRAPARPPGLAELTFNYGRNEVRSFLDLQRLLLARRVPRRRPAPRRRGLDALPRLLAQRPASGCRTATAAARTSRPSSSCASATPRSTARFPGALSHRRGVDGLARRDAPRRGGRPRLRLQVGPRLDARHPRLPRRATRSTAATTTTS